MKISFGPSFSSNKKVKSSLKFSSLFNLDTPFFILLASNILTIIFAVIENWDFTTLIWIYWAQSVIIGIFTFIKILNLKNFTTDNFYINHRPVEPTPQTRTFVAFFFLFHYGVFHFAYLVFLLKEITLSFSNILLILIPIAIFFSNHLFSFLQNFQSDINKKQNIGKAMFHPYARIIPMHLTIVFGIFLAQSTEAILFFLVLKTIADLVMHQFEHL